MNKPYNTVLICRDSNGAPSSYPARIQCSPDQFSEVEYLDALCEKAEADGYCVDNEIPMVVNFGDPLWEPFSYVYDDADWDNAPLIVIE